MSETIRATEYKKWDELGLDEMSRDPEYVNQEESGYGNLQGEWWQDGELPDGRRVIIFGTFGNDHSPGASHYTYAEVYDMTDPEDAAVFAKDLAEWEAKEEFLPSEEETCFGCGEVLDPDSSHNDGENYYCLACWEEMDEESLDTGNG